MAEKKVDTTTTIAIVGGATVLGVGAWLMFKKPPGVSPGASLIAQYKFEYLGEGGLYAIQLRLGYHRMANWFDPEEGLLWVDVVELPEPGVYEHDLEFTIPDGTPARTYDAEASIRTVHMLPEDRLIRVFKDKAVTVRKE